MDDPPIVTIRRDEVNKNTFYIHAYRKLTSVEAENQIGFWRAQVGNKLEKGASYKIISTLGIGQEWNEEFPPQ